MLRCRYFHPTDDMWYSDTGLAALIWINTNVFMLT